MEQLETEIKLRLPSFPDYLKLIGFLGSMDDEQHQQNAFFDSEDHRLAKLGWALRVRVDNKSGLITMKNATTEPEMPFSRREIEDEIDRSLALEIIELRKDLLSVTVAPVQLLLEMLPNIELARLVRFQNTRCSKEFALGDRNYVLEVDSIHYSDGSADYELEVELTEPELADKVLGHLEHLFSTIGIPFEEQPLTKLARALQKNAVSG